MLSPSSSCRLAGTVGAYRTKGLRCLSSLGGPAPLFPQPILVLGPQPLVPTILMILTVSLYTTPPFTLCLYMVGTPPPPHRPRGDAWDGPRPGGDHSMAMRSDASSQRSPSDELPRGGRGGPRKCDRMECVQKTRRQGPPALASGMR